MAAPLLQTQDLSMHFGGVRAVRRVNFSLAEGELRCLIGPNGAGKSTFFKMLTGQLEPTHGQVLFRGQDISHAHAHDIARLGGFNGIPGIPPLNFPGNKASPIDLEGMFYLATASLLLTYFGLRLLLASRFGRIIVGIRENERRAELLGYDPRAYKLATFTIGGALAGFAGCLFANWGNFVSPTIFGLAQSAQILIWVIVGGRGTLIGPIVGCIGIQWLTTALGANQPSGGSDVWAKIFANAPLIFGVILIAFVLLVPKGLVPTLGDLGQWLLTSFGKRAKTRLQTKQAEEG